MVLTFSSINSIELNKRIERTKRTNETNDNGSDDSSDPATATDGGVGGVDSDAIAVAITAGAADKWTDDETVGLFSSGTKAMAKRGPAKHHKQHNNQSGCGRGCEGW